MASGEGHVEIVRFLLLNDADIDRSDNEGESPIYYCIYTVVPPIYYTTDAL